MTILRAYDAASNKIVLLPRSKNLSPPKHLTYRGLFRARVSFWDESYLTIDEVIDTEPGYPEILRYSYTYLKGDEHIFRYDNAPHYPDLPTFPHHKHTGPNEIPQASEKPPLSQVLKEIEQILSET
ncbi:MAG: hypothetical protein HYR94_20395 [Chloroflexi bacterium]|nr:hypothetical protein [Chloroflexota bacterium]